MRSGLVHEGEEETSAEPAEVHAASRGAFELRSDRVAGGKLVDDGGIEPPTSALRTQRSPS